jgi:hypothetical protein
MRQQGAAARAAVPPFVAFQDQSAESLNAGATGGKKWHQLLPENARHALETCFTSNI